MSEEFKNEAGMPDLSRIIGMLGSNPQLISSLLSGIGGSKEKSGASDKESLPALPPPIAITKGKSGKRELLCALKPFLSPQRCENIDRILHMYDLFDLLKNYR